MLCKRRARRAHGSVQSEQPPPGALSLHQALFGPARNCPLVQVSQQSAAETLYYSEAPVQPGRVHHSRPTSGPLNQPVTVTIMQVGCVPPCAVGKIGLGREYRVVSEHRLHSSSSKGVAWRRGRHVRSFTIMPPLSGARNQGDCTRRQCWDPRYRVRPTCHGTVPAHTRCSHRRSRAPCP